MKEYLKNVAGVVRPTSPVPESLSTPSRLGPLESTPSSSSGKSASFHKLRHINDKDCTNLDKGSPLATATGYRLLDVEILAEVFGKLTCPECMNTSLQLYDEIGKKNGCANLLVIVCDSCQWFHSFYTSKEVKGTYEVNRRLVYGMRLIGNSFSGLKKLVAVMNMPSLPTKNNYSKLNKSLRSVVHNVAQESMQNAGKKVKAMLSGEGSDCGVSVDGSWQKPGYILLNGCVSVISMDTGKVLDVEAMSRNCKQCQVYHKLDKGSQKFTEWKKNHTDCKANFIGSAPAMEPEGAIRMFKRSVKKHGLYYTKFYDDGDSKKYP